MSFLVAGAAVITAGVEIAKMIQGNKQAKEARVDAQKSKAELNKSRDMFESMDTSNPYLNMENAYEDLTVNKQAAEFQRDTQMQNQANIMQQMRGSAGGSGIAALAQQMASQGQLATQRASASIGQQEAANQRLMAQGAQDVLAREQLKARGASEAEAQRLGGAEAARGLEYQKQQGLMGLASGELQASNQAVADAQAQKSAGISGIIGGVASGLGAAAGGGLFDKIGGKVFGEGFKISENM